MHFLFSTAGPFKGIVFKAAALKRLSAAKPVKEISQSRRCEEVFSSQTFQIFGIFKRRRLEDVF